MRFAYILIAYLFAPIVCGVMLWRGFRDRSYWQNFHERFGYGDTPFKEPSIWIHAVSVGRCRRPWRSSGHFARSIRRYPWC